MGGEHDKRRPVTYQDLIDLPEAKVGEIVEGELYASPRPTGRHAVATSVLGYELAGPFQLGRNGPGGWWILDEPEIHLGSNVLVPDIAGWKRERLHGFDNPYFTIAPDWICEVLSPSTARLDRVRKMRVYAQGLVEFAWLVDPILRSLETFVRDGDGWKTAGAYEVAEKVRARPFEEVEIDLSALWLPSE